MRGKDIKLLREKSENRFSNREMAQMLGINERTLINWEASEDELSPPYQTFLGQIFEDVIIKTAQKTLDKLFKVVPAEHLAIWCYLGHDKIALFRNSARHCYIQDGAIRSFQNDEIIKDLNDTSLTTAPLAYAVTINDSGKSIESNRYKAFTGTRYVHYLHNHQLESILKLPRFMKGPKPLYLLSAENKLRKNGSKFEVITDDEVTGRIFTEADVEAYTSALEQEEDGELTELLIMFFAQK